MTGIEPATSEPQSGALPLSYAHHDGELWSVTLAREGRQHVQTPYLLRAACVSALWLALACVCAPARAGAQTPPSTRPDQNPGDVVATVGDRSITLDDIDRAWEQRDPASRAQARQQLFEARQRALDDLIGDYLIELEAKTRQVSPSQLLEAEVAKRMKPVTDADIARVFGELGSRAEGATLEQLTPPIRQFLEQQRPVLAREEFVQDLRRASKEVRISLNPPRLSVTTAASDPTWGPANAPVQIIEFSDFQCPFCQRAGPVLQKLRATFGDRVRLVFKDLPLPSHPNAFQAAEAAQCAHEQSKFWEYHDVLFANQNALGRDDLKRHAAGLGLDAAKFNACFDEGRTGRLVQADMNESERYGVSSTPTFFINGRLLSGAQPFEVFDRIIQEELGNIR